jgi:hypothetical protein
LHERDSLPRQSELRVFLSEQTRPYYYFRILKTMIVETADATKAAFDLPLVDKAWLVVFMAANVTPILFWSVIEGWTRSPLPLLAAR